MKTRLVLLRHGETISGSQGRYAGQSETRLTKQGKAQIRRIRSRFWKFRPQRIFSSDLIRCRETVEILAPHVPVSLSRALREMNFGTWEGLSRAQVQRKWGTRYRTWLANPERISPPRGESLAHLAKRVRTFARRIANRFPRQTVAFVTHGGPIRVLLGKNLSEFWSAQVTPASLWIREMNR